MLRRVAITSLLTATIGAGMHKPVAADPLRVGWPQPAGSGTPVVITYSYSNLLDGTLLLIDGSDLRAATEEALGLWASYAPLQFVELADSGPAPSDLSYPAAGSPQIRIGHHSTGTAAHGFFPDAFDGLGGDIHVDSGAPWSLDGGTWNFLEVLTHELGHALGLVHIDGEPAILNPSYPQQRFTGLGSAFLFKPDIDQLQQLYGSGIGSVTPADPTPEPATLVLTAVGLAGLAYRRSRLRRQ